MPPVIIILVSLWGAVFFVPLVYMGLNIKRVRKNHIQNDRPVSLARDPIFFWWGAVQLATIQIGVLLTICSLADSSAKPADVFGIFMFLAPIFGMIVALTEVAWQKKPGDPALSSNMHDGYKFLLWANPVGIARLAYLGFRKFFLPCRA